MRILRGNPAKTPLTMVALAVAGESIQPSQPTMPPYTPFTNPPPPPATKRLTEQPRQQNFWAYSIFRNSGTKNTVAQHQQSNRPPDHDYITSTAARPQPGSLPITTGAPSITNYTQSHTPINRVAPHRCDHYPSSTTTWNHTPTDTQALKTKKEEKTETASLSFTCIVGTAYNPHSNMAHPQNCHHCNNLPLMTMPWLQLYTSLQCLTMLPPPYNHPVPQASEHSHPRSDTTATTWCYTCQTTSTCTNTWITMDCHNYQAQASKTDRNLNPSPEFDKTLNPSYRNPSYQNYQITSSIP